MSDTQVCRECKKEKDLKEFHISGAKYRFVCQSCIDAKNQSIEIDDEKINSNISALNQKLSKEIKINESVRKKLETLDDIKKNIKNLKEETLKLKMEHKKKLDSMSPQEIGEYRRLKIAEKRLKLKIDTETESPISLCGDNPQCPVCNSAAHKAGIVYTSSKKVQRWRCKTCNHHFSKL